MLLGMGKWCTVTVTDSEGKRYSLDVNADSSCDAAHLYLTHVRNNAVLRLSDPNDVDLVRSRDRRSAFTAFQACG